MHRRPRTSSANRCTASHNRLVAPRTGSIRYVFTGSDLDWHILELLLRLLPLLLLLLLLQQLLLLQLLLLLLLRAIGPNLNAVFSVGAGCHIVRRPRPQ